MVCRGIVGSLPNVGSDVKHSWYVGQRSISVYVVLIPAKIYLYVDILARNDE